MARYQIILAYDGTDFQGFQRLKGGRSVQGEVEAALRRLNWAGKAILSAGRTDAGVHASGQVIAFDLDWAHSPETLRQALNAYLPEDVAAQAVKLAAPGFHPRYDALARTYHYRIFHHPVRDPLRERYAWRVDHPVDGQLLNAAAALLVGTHDFAAFGSPPKKGGRTVRSVHAADWVRGEQPDEWTFRVTANAFLYHMVRRMVYLTVRVGMGKLGLDQLAREIDGAEMTIPGLAPPGGLTLVHVQYPPDGQEHDGFVETLTASGENDSGEDVRH
ncbi:MAG TPA: tRNA pseudouridine(38-40) synthase TruA [Chloroflexi bacterium]|nr:tRNA pseudouridine(38-40) synthase TruA [Chloroflexota bacterium]